MKKSLLLVVALLAVASLLAVAAYTSAVVENDFTVAVANTHEALLAIEGGDHAAAYYPGDPANGLAERLAIDLARGNDNERFGIQPGSIYIWEQLFKVTNNSENTVDVFIYLDPNEMHNLFVDGSLDLSAEDEQWVNLSDANVGGATGGSLEFSLDPGEYQYIDMRTRIGKGMSQQPGDKDWNLIVSAEAVVGGVYE